MKEQLHGQKKQNTHNIVVDFDVITLQSAFFVGATMMMVNCVR